MKRRCPHPRLQMHRLFQCIVLECNIATRQCQHSHCACTHFVIFSVNTKAGKCFIMVLSWRMITPYGMELGHKLHQELLCSVCCYAQMLMMSIKIIIHEQVINTCTWACFASWVWHCYLLCQWLYIYMHSVVWKSIYVIYIYTHISTCVVRPKSS